MKKILLFVAITIFIAIPFSKSTAFEVRVDNSVRLNKEEIADGNVYASCEDMNIDGTVNGDIFAICKNIVINGTVSGDLIAFSNNVTINGEVKGSVRVAGTSLNINGAIGHNINSFGTEINLTPSSTVGWDVLVVGVNGVFDGNIGGNLHGYIKTAAIKGKINKNINLTIDDSGNNTKLGGIFISKDAVIGGGVTYLAEKEINLESPSSVAGEINRQKSKSTSDNLVNILSKMFYKLSALLLIGLIIVTLKKEIIYSTISTLKSKWWQATLIGLSSLIITPALILFFSLTVIGIPLAIIILTGYLTFIFLALISSSFFIGDLLIKIIFKESVNAFIILITGLIIFTILSSLPYFGAPISLFFVTWGLGGLFLTIKQKQND